MNPTDSRVPGEYPSGWVASSAGIVGAALGSAIGTFTQTPGGAIGGAVLGEAFAHAVEAMANRQLTARQEQRVGLVVPEAAAALKVLEVKGRTVRDDGFFDGGRSTGDEVIEGVLLAAKSTYQERKLRYLGNMLASIACSDTIDGHTANLMIRTADSLSWLHLVVMSLIDSDEYHLPETEPGPTMRDWSHWTPTRALIQLRDNLGMATFPHDNVTGNPGTAMDLRMSALHLTTEGILIARSMELSTIPRADLMPVFQSFLESPDDPS